MPRASTTTNRPPPAERAHRGTIFVEDAEILANDGFAGEQYVLRVRAPRLAGAAAAGAFAHVQCHRLLPMRRPLSIMRVDAAAGWAEFLYKVVGAGSALLAGRRPGERMSVMGPIGRPFEPHPERRLALLVGGGVGIPPMIFLADHLRRRAEGFRPFVLMGSEVPFPFTPRPSQMLVPGMPAGAIACMPLMEDWGIPSRLASLQGFAGCFEGFVTDLAQAWLDALAPEQRDEVEIFACGPTPMLEATAAIAASASLPCQVSLEEYMACAVGGCAGCTVRVATEHGPAMKRVCVDGPVFDAHAVQWRGGAS